MKYMKRKKTRGRTDLYGKRARNREDGCGETSVSVYSHTREPPDGGRGGGIRNISIVICHPPHSYIHGLYRSPAADGYTTSPNVLSITNPSFSPSTPSYAVVRFFRAPENRNILISIVHYVHSLSQINRILICKSVYCNADVFLFPRIEGIPPSAGK